MKPGTWMRSSLTFIQKKRVAGLRSFSSTQATPTLPMASMRCFSAALRSGTSRLTYFSGTVEITRSAGTRPVAVSTPMTRPCSVRTRPTRADSRTSPPAFSSRLW